MKLPDEVTVKCGMCGAEHKVQVSYTEEIRDNAITFRIHAQLTPDFTRHVARTHLMVDGLPQVLTKNGAESSDDADAGDEASTTGKELSLSHSISEQQASSARDRLDAHLAGRDGPERQGHVQVPPMTITLEDEG